MFDYVPMNQDIYCYSYEYDKYQAINERHVQMNCEVKNKEMRRQQAQIITFERETQEQMNRILDDFNQFKKVVPNKTIHELTEKVNTNKLFRFNLLEDKNMIEKQNKILNANISLKKFAQDLEKDQWNQIERQRIPEKGLCIKNFRGWEQDQKNILNDVEEQISKRSSSHQQFIESLKEFQDQRIQMIVSNYNKFDEQITNMLKLNKLSPYEQFNKHQVVNYGFKMRYGIRINDFLDKLMGSELLRSTNIDFFTNYLMEKQRQMNFDSGVDHLVTSTSFWNTYHPGSVSGQNRDSYTDQTISINQMKFQNKKTHLTDFQSICCPLNITNTHWVMVQSKKGQLICVDSLNGMFTGKQSKGGLNIYLQGLLELIRKDNPNCGKMEEILQPGPQQNNGYDCGVFTIFNCFCKVQGKEFSQIISNYRKRLYYMMLIIETSPKDQQLDILLLDYIEGLNMQFRSIYF